MSDIFISYRRGDSIDMSGRLSDRLAARFGRDHVFVDVDGIALGSDFSSIIRARVAACDVLLAVIGRNWLDARDEAGQRRLWDPQDFVRIELAAALERGNAVRIIPVLVDGARMPRPSDLPEPLRPFAMRNGIDVRSPYFNHDIEPIIAAIGGARAESPADRGSTRRPVASMLAAAWALAVVIGGGVAYWSLAPVTTLTAPKAATVSTGIDTALGELKSAVAGADGRVGVHIAGGDRVRLKQRIAFEVESSVAGQLTLIDLDAGGDAVRLFPNDYVTTGAVAAQVPMTVPDKTYSRFEGFEAREPLGRGRILAIVSPNETPLAAEPRNGVRTKGFVAVHEPGEWLLQIARSVRERIAASPDGSKGWAFGVTSYEIVD